MSITEHDLSDAVNMLRSDFEKALDGVRRDKIARLPAPIDPARIRDIESRIDQLELTMTRLLGIVETIALEQA